MVKYFAWASFIVLVLFSFPLSMVISQKAKDILTKSYEDYAIITGKNLVRQVYHFFWSPTISRFGQIKLSDKDQYTVMDRVVKNTIYDLKIDVVNIYSISQGMIAYSTDPDRIGEQVIESPGYKKALKGEHSSSLISGGNDFLGLEIGNLREKKIIRTYIPFQPTLRNEEVVISGVFELTQDMTEQYQSIVNFQFMVFGLSILIMALIFFALLMIVRKAEGIIEQRAGEQRALEEQLHLAERLAVLGEMVAGVSHEIKNPLGIIQSTAELLTGMSETNEAQKKLSSVITEESVRLNRIVTEFLDFARPQALNLIECKLEDIIHKSLKFLELEFKKQEVTVINNLQGTPYKLRADQDLLYRALLNLFINAMQAMNEKRTIHVSLRKEKADYLIEIQDTGKGITSEELTKIFNPFFTTKSQGSGLGLSIVKKIVEGHRGTIGIESHGNSGTKVTIRLPKDL